MQPASISLPLPKKHERLARRLEEFRSAARPGHLSLALRLESEPLFLDYDGPETLRMTDGAASPWIPAGCLAKPLTATLLATAISEGRLEWNSRVDDILEVRGPARNRLAGITLSHLLNHTHGLDASRIDAVPRTRAGLIDPATLCEQLASSALNSPGELYSYSNAGAWLAGAALERLTGTPYSQLLWETPAIVSGNALEQSGRPSPLCPATGGPLALPITHWLSFAEHHASSDPLSPDPRARGVASLRASQAPLPGWSPAEQAACLGWKYYGEGWFGHTANTATSIAFLRFHPADRLAIVMSASSDIALFAFSVLFRDYFPELKNLKFPRRLTREEGESVRPDSYEGIYAQAKAQIRIAQTDTGRLSFAITSDDPALSASAQPLQPADNQVFFPEGKRNPEFPFLQFLPASGREPFSHLWNGKHLWRRQ